MSVTFYCWQRIQVKETSFFCSISVTSGDGSIFRCHVYHRPWLNGIPISIVPGSSLHLQPTWEFSLALELFWSRNLQFFHSWCEIAASHTARNPWVFLITKTIFKFSHVELLTYCFLKTLITCSVKLRDIFLTDYTDASTICFTYLKLIAYPVIRSAAIKSVYRSISRLLASPNVCTKLLWLKLLSLTDQILFLAVSL